MYGKNVGNYVLTYIEHLHIIYRCSIYAKCEMQSVNWLGYRRNIVEVSLEHC